MDTDNRLVYEKIWVFPNGYTIRRCDGKKDSEMYCLFRNESDISSEAKIKDYEKYLDNIIYIFRLIHQNNKSDLTEAVHMIFRYIHENDGQLLYSSVFEQIAQKCNSLPYISDENKEKFTMIFSLLYCYMCAEWKYLKKNGKTDILGSNITMYFYEICFLCFPGYLVLPADVMEVNIRNLYHGTYSNHNIKKECKEFGLPYLEPSFMEEEHIRREDGKVVHQQLSLL